MLHHSTTVLATIVAAACGGGDPTPDAATRDAGRGDAGTCEPWPFAGVNGSEMLPGEPCLDCHDPDGSDSAPFTAAGTVFDTFDRRSGCRGVGDLEVFVMGADGEMHRALTGPSGNFHLTAPIEPPLAAWVVRGEETRAMGLAVGDGDCNRCHTREGTEEAPGRIVAPPSP